MINFDIKDDVVYLSGTPSELNVLYNETSAYIAQCNFDMALKRKYPSSRYHLLKKTSSTCYTIPVGSLLHVLLLCKQHNFDIIHEEVTNSFYNHTDLRAVVASTDFALQPYSYQNYGVVAALKYKHCIIAAPTGSGKTYIMYMLAKILAPKHNILVLTPTLLIHEQTITRYKQYGNINVGTLKEIDTADVVVSTYQSVWSLVKKKGITALNRFTVILDDECHGSNSHSKMEILTKKHWEYKIGFTATIPKDKYKELQLIHTIGTVIVIKKVADLIGNKLSEINMYRLDNDKQYYFSNFYNDELEEICNDNSRNIMLASYVNKSIANKRNVLVISKRLNHLDVLSDLVTANNKFTLTDGVAVPAAEIEHCINNSTGNAIFATYGKVSTGLDISNLDTIYLAVNVRSDIAFVQTIGRSLRKSTNGINSAVILVNDSRSKFSSRHYNASVKVFNKVFTVKNKS